MYEKNTTYAGQDNYRLDKNLLIDKADLNTIYLKSQNKPSIYLIRDFLRIILLIFTYFRYFVNNTIKRISIIVSRIQFNKDVS